MHCWVGEFKQFTAGLGSSTSECTSECIWVLLYSEMHSSSGNFQWKTTKWKRIYLLSQNFTGVISKSKVLSPKPKILTTSLRNFLHCNLRLLLDKRFMLIIISMSWSTNTYYVFVIIMLILQSSWKLNAKSFSLQIDNIIFKIYCTRGKIAYLKINTCNALWRNSSNSNIPSGGCHFGFLWSYVPFATEKSENILWIDGWQLGFSGS